MRRLMSRRWMAPLGVVALTLVMLAGCAPLGGAGGGSLVSTTIPRFQHIFVIVMENHEYDEIIGSNQAPHINALANQYGLATNYWAVAHPSEPNYVAMVGGDTYGVNDDASFTLNAINAPYLGSQLEAAKLTWKSYQQGLPSAGFTGETATTSGALYASKHNPFMNFLAFYPQSQQAAELANVVPDTQLMTDLAKSDAPTFSFIVPGLCDDMHGDPACGSNNQLTSAGDTYVNNTVTEIMQSSVWSQGNNAIFIVWDESSLGVDIGPSGIATGGGHVPAIVITNHGPRGVKDNTAYNHYSLLLTIESAFGLECLANACPSNGGVQPMSPLMGS